MEERNERKYTKESKERKLEKQKLNGKRRKKGSGERNEENIVGK